ncbi:MAG: ImmA/IrrE family metallo-endopeptidase [Myxococcales bacterium]|nr:ImmA/IrrE family metallo-endopeptidase [Myxococcales bacterium]
MAKSWEDFGKRVQNARKAAGLTQLELAAELGAERTVVTKIESGQRTVDCLTSPLGREPPRRQDMMRRRQLQALAQDVEQLIEMGALQPVDAKPAAIESLAAAEAVALTTRQAAGLRVDEPAWELVALVERLGLYAFVLGLQDDGPAQAEGSYLALRRGGVALIGNAGGSGRRRFRIAHELGHHVLADEFAPEWIVGAGATEREKVINAFAIHFLLPRPAAEQRWRQYGGPDAPRDAAIRIAVEFGLSWGAACAQLQRVGCLSAPQYDAVAPATPTGLDLVERELRVRSDVEAPQVPPGYAAAVVRALKRGRIGPTRAIELLHGTISERDLPPERPLSLDAMTAELDVLPE